MRLTLKVWRQPGPSAPGAFHTYDAPDVSDHMSFLEMLDVVNEGLIEAGEEPIEFDHDCREGICGMCSLVINGVPHGPRRATTTCQLHMRHFRDGDTITVEPWRAKAFPIVKDLVTDRSAFDRIIEAGGFVSIHTGGAPDGNAIPVPKTASELATDAAACIGCGACVAACKNASAHLFVSAKISHLALLRGSVVLGAIHVAALGLRQRRARGILLPNCFVLEDHAADKRGTIRGCKKHFAVGTPAVFCRLDLERGKPFGQRRNRFVRRQNSLAFRDKRFRRLLQLLLFHDDTLLQFATVCSEGGDSAHECACAYYRQSFESNTVKTYRGRA